MALRKLSGKAGAKAGAVALRKASAKAGAVATFLSLGADAAPEDAVRACCIRQDMTIKRWFMCPAYVYPCGYSPSCVSVHVVVLRPVCVYVCEGMHMHTEDVTHICCAFIFHVHILFSLCLYVYIAGVLYTCMYIYIYTIYVCKHMRMCS